MCRSERESYRRVQAKTMRKYSKRWWNRTNIRFCPPFLPSAHVGDKTIFIGMKWYHSLALFAFGKYNGRTCVEWMWNGTFRIGLIMILRVEANHNQNFIENTLRRVKFSILGYVHNIWTRLKRMQRITWKRHYFSSSYHEYHYLRSYAFNWDEIFWCYDLIFK